jgi:hypothetical protein
MPKADTWSKLKFVTDPRMIFEESKPWHRSKVSLAGERMLIPPFSNCSCRPIPTSAVTPWSAWGGLWSKYDPRIFCSSAYHLEILWDKAACDSRSIERIMYVACQGVHLWNIMLLMWLSMSYKAYTIYEYSQFRDRHCFSWFWMI